MSGIRAISLAHFMPDLPMCDYTGQRMEGGAEERVAYEEGGMEGRSWEQTVLPRGCANA